MATDTFNLDSLGTNSNPLENGSDTTETAEKDIACEFCGFYGCTGECEDENEDDDGQPTLYEEMQDYFDGDDKYNHFGDIDNYDYEG